ncbi:MAG TPA: hypothetical protein VH601_08545 [Bryobacteraceae bacterium]
MTAFSKGAFLFLIFTGSIFAQHLDFGVGIGVKGGVPFTDILKLEDIITTPATVLNRSTDYLIGPVVELRIPFGFAFEVDGIYRSAEYHLTTNDITIDAHSWEIPYLAKFRFPIPLLKPFVSAGGAYRSFTDLPGNIVTPTHNAFVLGGGLELRISRLRLSGELRWLRWNNPPDNGNVVRLDQNQGEVLFGLVF